MSQILIPQSAPSLEETQPTPEELEVEQEAKDKEIKDILKTLTDSLLEKEIEFRRLKLAVWRRNELLWRNVQRLLWDETSLAYRSITEFSAEDFEGTEILPEEMNGTINIIRAFGESVIGALSATLPSTKFWPKDADNPVDLITAKTFSIVAELIAKYNVSPIIFLRALYILFIEDYVAAYTHYEEDKKFGTHPNEVYREETRTENYSVCATCGSSVDDTDLACPTCGSQEPPVNETAEVTDVVFDHIDHEIKGRVIIEVYGPSNVIIPLSARDQASCPFLALDTEVHIAAIRQRYGVDVEPNANVDDYNSGMWARLPPEQGNQSGDYSTVRKMWIRPWAYHQLKNDDQISKLTAEYPEGCCVDIVDREVLECDSSDLDEFWTISVNPLSRFLHADAPANLVVPIQEMYTDLIDLIMETIRQGITEVFADVQALDWNNYSKTEKAPGLVNPATARPGQSLSNSFFQVNSATLSKEVQFFLEKLEQMGQFVIGAFPSIYGGPQESGKTAREYELSRNNALQRLGVLWKIINAWWPSVMTKSCLLFRKKVKYDENMVKPNGSSFVNVWVRRMDMLGEIADITPEISDQFPVSWAEQRDVVLQAIQTNNQAILATVFDPENMELVKKVFGIESLVIPGMADREKQLMEIAELLKGQPNPDGSPSVPVERLVDDNDLCVRVIRAWLVSTTGIDAKMNNQPGYANVMAQYQARLALQQQQMQEKALAEAAANPDKSGKSKEEPPSPGEPRVNPPEENLNA